MTRNRQIALVLLVIAVTGGGSLLAYLLSLLLGGASEEIDELVFRAQRLHRVAASADSWHARADAIRSQVAEEKQFLDGDTPALAAASLQASLKEMIGGAGGSVSSSQTSPPRDERGFTRVGVRMVLTGGMETLRRLLHAVESSRPFLLVSTMNVSPQRGGGPTEPWLSIDIEVYGYLKPQQ